MSTHNPSALEQTVMRRVRRVHTLSILTGAPAAAVALFAVALVGIGQEVFVAQVIANMPPVEDVDAITTFLLVAFTNTTFIVQALSVVAIGTLVYLAHAMSRIVLPGAQTV